VAEPASEIGFEFDLAGERKEVQDRARPAGLRVHERQA